FRRPQSGSIPTKSASCSYHALSRKARASAAQYGFPDARSRWASLMIARARSLHGFLTGSSRSGRRVLPLANLARLIVVACRVIGSSHLSLSNPSTRKPLGLMHLAQIVGRRREKQGHFGLGVGHESSRRRLRGLLVPGQDDGFPQHFAVDGDPAAFGVSCRFLPGLLRGAVPPGRSSRLTFGANPLRHL